ncbi:hypothetical protein T4D_16784 [Trichinella pseudospiralis]|uniref:Uncharacterized protein n=1 Tax=Trichinella pseudospiralis TaxID=6337 RepID=A0A0V1EKN5_TRIPS|nr:hypothetical protein T4D_16784 [Trichinella pseudospiralis]
MAIKKSPNCEKRFFAIFRKANFGAYLFHNY